MKTRARTHSVTPQLGISLTTMHDETPLERFERYRNDPLAFLSECVYTKDPVDELAPIKLYPGHKPYLQFIIRLWQRKKMLAIPKSRRMTMSWTMIPLAVWDCIFHKGKAWAFVSKKETDSQELVERAEFVFKRIPPEKIPRALLPTLKGDKMTQSPPKLVFEFGDSTTSTIEGFPMGANQLRQFAFSGIFGDECAFWPDAEEFYSGAKPTTDGGGRMVLVSSRAPGFFKKIVFDKINHLGNNFAERPPATVKHPMTGIEVWENPTNKFTVLDLHYTADIDKRGDAFREALKSAMPLHKFLREYEKNWQTFEGMPVYPNFRADIHTPVQRPHPILGLPILFGWDFGLSPSCIAVQLQGNSLKILHEWVTQNEGIETFAPKAMSEFQLIYPEFRDMTKHHHFIDPAGFQRAQTDARTCAQAMTEAAPIYNLEPGPVDWENRRSSVEHFLLHIEKAGAGLELNPDTCPVLLEGFTGGYRYPDSNTDIAPDKARPIKNMYSHPHDALQYVCWGARSKQHSHGLVTIPIPQYGNTKQTISGVNTYGRKAHND